VPFANPAPLRREIETRLPDRPFTVEFWDGSTLPATAEGGPTFSVRSPRAAAHALRAPGQLGLGRAYVSGELDVDDIDATITLLNEWQPPALDAADKRALMLAAVRAMGITAPPPLPAAELRPSGKRHSKERDARAVRHHYDVSNEFFALFLDRSMTYSCALFEHPGQSLEDAQRAKLELICRKLGLRRGMRVLDIGSGWGSFAIHAAREHGASVLGITLSPPQAELARRRAAEAGVSELVDFQLRDYRDLAGERFDAVSSIGMIEHVGASQIDEYAQVIADVLAPEGLVLNHGITWSEPEVHIGAAFSERYVFPGGEIPPLSRVLAAFERAGLEVHHVESLHEHYSETLRHWAANLDRHREEAERLAGAERLRVWRLYLRAARNGFELGDNLVHQTLAGHRLTEPSSPQPGGAPERSLSIRRRLLDADGASPRRRSPKSRSRLERVVRRP
jgi:cyclopropane-fatty-acyl-phospholipid synthase